MAVTDTPNTPSSYESHPYDVVVIGAGGAGLRAAIEASAQGANTALICKSLLGKAHTVMAEGGIAAALGKAWAQANRQGAWAAHPRGARRRPHRPGDDPHAAAARRPQGHRRVHGVHDQPAAEGRRPRGRRDG